MHGRCGGGDEKKIVRCDDLLKNFLYVILHAGYEENSTYLPISLYIRHNIIIMYTSTSGTLCVDLRRRDAVLGLENLGIF